MPLSLNYHVDVKHLSILEYILSDYILNCLVVFVNQIGFPSMKSRDALMVMTNLHKIKSWSCTSLLALH